MHPMGKRTLLFSNLFTLERLDKPYSKKIWKAEVERVCQRLTEQGVSGAKLSRARRMHKSHLCKKYKGAACFTKRYFRKQLNSDGTRKKLVRGGKDLRGSGAYTRAFCYRLLQMWSEARAAVWANKDDLCDQFSGFDVARFKSDLRGIGFPDGPIPKKVRSVQTVLKFCALSN